MNKAIFLGRLTRDPEIRTTQSGGTMARFSIAVDRRFKREGQPEADFFNCLAFNKTADFVSKYLNKGTKILIEGEVQQNDYTDKNGTKHYGVQVLVNQIEFAESKASQGGQSEQTAVPDDFMEVDDSVDDSGIPFV